MKKLALTLLLLLPLLFSACAQNASEEVLEPSPIDNQIYKNVTIKAFKDDSVALAQKIEDRLGGVYQGQNYFNIASNDAAGKDTAVIEGRVKTHYSKDNLYYDWEEDYSNCIEHKGSRCKKYKKIKKACRDHEYEVTAKIRVKDYNGEVLFEKEYYKDDKSYHHCTRSTKDQTYKSILMDDILEKKLPPKQEFYDKLAKKIAKQFVKEITSEKN
jgi:hypothetical protein